MLHRHPCCVVKPTGLLALWAIISLISPSVLLAADPPDFSRDVQPILRKYCNGCHNAQAAEGKLNLTDYAGVLKGGSTGALIKPDDAKNSLLWKVISGQAEPKMPPEDEAQLKPEELSLLQAWIAAGAKPPADGELVHTLTTPTIPTAGPVRQPITALAIAPDQTWIAIARPSGVQIQDLKTGAQKALLEGHTGAVNDVSLSQDGKTLVIAAGETGLYGEVTLWNTADWTRQAPLRGHRDTLYSARLSPDETQIATASYDRTVRIWDRKTQAELAVMAGHNDAIYGIAFHPNGRWIVSASGDRTLKLWNVATGGRLETFSQPAKEQYTTAISPDGKVVVGGGADNRLRVWEFSETAAEGTNLLRFARFAHEGPILKIVFSPDGRLLATSSEDRRLKIWETGSFTQVAVLEEQPDWAAALAFTPDSRRLAVGRMNGDLAHYDIQPGWSRKAAALQQLTAAPSVPTPVPAGQRSLSEVVETEANDSLETAQAVTLPAQIRGTFAKPGDQDIYRFSANQGEVWVLETNAARSQSSADTRLEILHPGGEPVQRAILQAVRDSWITFRPIDSSQLLVRVEYWEEMDLNQYLYMNGEIGKFFMAPRGPDSGYTFYDHAGKRLTYFDTTAVAHAMEEPVYIVEAYPAGSAIVENGLPTFPLYYQNDDDGERELGTDSRLTFTAPADGEYFVRIADSRGFGGDKYHYQLTIRPASPDFDVQIATTNLKIPAGSGQRLRFTVDRKDGFEEPITVAIQNLPPGFHAASPIVIEAGHLVGTSVLLAEADAPAPTKEQWEQVTVTATAKRGEQSLEKSVGNLGEIQKADAPKFCVFLEPDAGTEVAEDGSFVITSGTTITAKIRVERNNFEGDIPLNVEGLPHGIIVDHIGLSGVLVRKNETERQIFLTSRPWVPAGQVWINAISNNEGAQASPPVKLTVRKPVELAETQAEDK